MAKLKKSPLHGFVGNVEAALRQLIFYVSINQSEPGVEPYCVADDLRRDAVALEEIILYLKTLLQGGTFNDQPS